VSTSAATFETGTVARGFAGTTRLLRLALRRDRVRIGVWAAAIAGLVGVSAASARGLYGTAQQQMEYVRVIRDNAAMIVQSGPGYGLDHPTVGAIFMNETAIWTIVLVAILGILMTTRHTRLEEETARSELVRSAPVGRYAGATAGLLVVLVAQVIVAITVTLTVIGFGYGPVGAIAFGFSLVVAGSAFSAVTLVAAQVAASSRTASGLGLMTLGIAFVIRAYGDIAIPWLSWLSPIHWAQAVRAFAGERWFVLILPVVLTAVLLPAAAALAEHRDFGGGLLNPRPGKPEAAPTRYPLLTLTIRLHRGSIISWAIGVASGAFFLGVVADQVEQMAHDNPAMSEILSVAGSGSITDTYLATSMLIIGLLGAGFAISAALRMHTEEAAGRVDPLLATPVGRVRWAGSHLAVTTAALVALMAFGGLAGGLGAALALNDSSRILGMLGAGAAMAAGVAVLGATAFLLCTSVPRLVMLAWVPMMLAAFLSMFGRSLDLPSWLMDLSPFQHVPALPADQFEFGPAVALCLAAVGLITAGLLVLPHRDVGRV
jgi:ABC-2 type transport system permease protein